jgi:hypothetical protein
MSFLYFLLPVGCGSWLHWSHQDLHAVIALLDIFELVPIEFTLVSLFNIIARLDNHPFASLLSAIYNIAGTYCEPEMDVPKKRNNIQFLSRL